SAAHRPGAVAEGAGILQGVPAPSGCSELQPGSGHGRAQEGTDTREPVARMLAGDAGASQNEAPADVGKARWQAVSCVPRRAHRSKVVPPSQPLSGSTRSKIRSLCAALLATCPIVMIAAAQREFYAVYLFHHSLCNFETALIFIPISASIRRQSYTPLASRNFVQSGSPFELS